MGPRRLLNSAGNHKGGSMTSWTEFSGIDDYIQDLLREAAERGIKEDRVFKMLDEWFQEYHFPPDDLDQLIEGVLE